MTLGQYLKLCLHFVWVSFYVSILQFFSTLKSVHFFIANTATNSVQLFQVFQVNASFSSFFLADKVIIRSSLVLSPCFNVPNVYYKLMINSLCSVDVFFVKLNCFHSSFKEKIHQTILFPPVITGYINRILWFFSVLTSNQFWTMVHWYLSLWHVKNILLIVRIGSQAF